MTNFITPRKGFAKHAAPAGNRGGTRLDDILSEDDIAELAGEFEPAPTLNERGGSGVDPPPNGPDVEGRTETDTRPKEG